MFGECHIQADGSSSLAAKAESEAQLPRSEVAQAATDTSKTGLAVAKSGSTLSTQLPRSDFDGHSPTARTKSDSDLGCRPRADVITGKAIFWDTLYLIRLREDFDSRQSFHVKRLSEFRELDAQLREVAKKTPAQALTVPELPEKSRLGLRRQLSKLGMSGFMDKRHEAVQGYLDALMMQIPSVSTDQTLQAFFCEARSRQDNELLNTMRQECRSDVNLRTLKGHWQQKGSTEAHIWTIEETGQVLFDGEEGCGYYLVVQGEHLQLTISRADGRRVDIEKSTPHHIFWHIPGEEDLEWLRDMEFESSSTVLV